MNTKKHYPKAPETIFEMANRESTTRESYIKGNLFNDRLKISLAAFGHYGVLGLSGYAIFEGRLTVAILLGISGVALAILKSIINLFKPTNGTD